MEQFSFSPEPSSVRKTPPAGGGGTKVPEGGWVASRSDDGRSFFLPRGKNLCQNAVFRLLFVWADSIVVLFSVLVYELAGPTLTKIALTAAGEIRPEGRTCAHVENKPEEVA